MDVSATGYQAYAGFQSYAATPAVAATGGGAAATVDAAAANDDDRRRKELEARADNDREAKRNSGFVTPKRGSNLNIVV